MKSYQIIKWNQMAMKSITSATFLRSMIHVGWSESMLLNVTLFNACISSYLVTLTELVFFLEISVGSPASLKKIWAERYSEHLRASLQPNLKCYSKAIQCCPHPATFAIKSSSHFSIGICDFFNTTLLFIATSCSLWLCSHDTASCL